MAVDRVDPIQQRYAEASLQRVLLEVVVHVGPGFQAVAVVRIRTAAIENRAQKERFDLAQIFHVLLIGLSHLADLLVEGHLPEQFFDPGIDLLWSEWLGLSG